MSALKLLSTRLGLQTVILVSRVLPQSDAYRLGRTLAAYVAQRSELTLVQNLAANLSVVLGRPANHPAVQVRVKAQLENTVLCALDLFRLSQSGREAVAAICQLDGQTTQTIDRLRSSGRGVLLVGAHTCGFDLALLAIGRHYPSMQALSNAQPTGSMALMNELRMHLGVAMTPISVRSLRQAMIRLRNGGLVAIAADLPLESGELLNFFGLPARLPTGHARLALSAGAAMLVGCSRRLGDRSYALQGYQVHRPPATGDRQLESSRWAQAALAVLERQIGDAPEQWLMPLPIWDGERATRRAPTYGPVPRTGVKLGARRRVLGEV